MKVSSARKATGMALTAVAILALATSSAFAGRGVGGDNGNKWGNDNKKDTYICPDGYSLFQTSNAADLNQDGYVCGKWTDDSYTYVDDITSSPHFST
jgi:hypothetical protein